MYDCEELEDVITCAGYTIKSAPLKTSDGLCKGHRIAIREDIPTLKKRADVLAEEWAHGEITVGDITDQTVVSNRKQERRARLLAYDIRFGLQGLVEAWRHGYHSRFEISEYLNVSEDTLSEALECYRQKYGTGIWENDCFIQFEPYFHIGQFVFFND